MIKEQYTIPISVISFIINVTLLFKSVDFNFVIEYIFCIFLAVCIGLLTYNSISINFSDNLVLCVLMGVGVFLYTSPFLLIVKIYLGLEFGYILFLQSKSIGAKTKNASAKNCKKLQQTDNVDIENDIRAGMKNKEICEKYGMEPYQVTRIKQKITDNES